MKKIKDKKLDEMVSDVEEDSEELETKILNKPMLVILDDWVGAGINMRTGLLPALLTKMRHARMSIFNLV